MLPSWQLSPARRGLAIAAAAATVALFAPGRSSAAPPDDFVTPAPPEVASVRVDEHLGAQVPLDLRFRDQDGNLVTLGDLVRGDLPVVLTFNYSNCPMLCSLQLNALVDTLPDLSLVAGGQFRIVSVLLEPKETPESATEMRRGYIEKLRSARKELREPAENGGWTFLVPAEPGDDASIRRLTEAVGIGYHYVESRGEWAHPAVLTFLSPSGTITRYVHGIQYDVQEVFLSLIRAGTSEPSAAVGFVQRCFHWEPPASSAARTGQTVMRFGAMAFAGLLLSGLVLAHILRRDSRRRPPGSPGSPPSGVGRS